MISNAPGWAITARATSWSIGASGQRTASTVANKTFINISAANDTRAFISNWTVSTSVNINLQMRKNIQTNFSTKFFIKKNNHAHARKG
jgi:ABC-type uncharacterized transport system permease subunit